MKELVRAAVFISIVAMGTFIICEIIADLWRITMEVRQERRREGHPAVGRPRHE